MNRTQLERAPSCLSAIISNPWEAHLCITLWAFHQTQGLEQLIAGYLGKISSGLLGNLKKFPATLLPQSKISVKRLQPTLLWAQEIPLAQREDQKGNYPEKHEEKKKTSYELYHDTVFLIRRYFRSLIWQIRFRTLTFFSSVIITFPQNWFKSNFWEALVPHLQLNF